MKRAIILAVLTACACGKATGTGGGGGGGSGGGGGGGGGSSADCEAARTHVADLYRAEAADKDPKLIDQLVADNTQMVMAECAHDPARVAACARQAKSAPELESKCLTPLDDEGTEGDKFKPGAQ